MQKIIIATLFLVFFGIASGCGKRKCNTCPTWGAIDVEVQENKA